MKFCNKFLNLFVILVVMFTTLTTSLTVPGIFVPAPGKGPWAIGSIQNVSWFCVLCKSTDDVKIEILKNGLNVVFTTTGKNAQGGANDFRIDPSWATVGSGYAVKVSLKNNQTIFGMSVPFTVYPTKVNLPKLWK